MQVTEHCTSPFCFSVKLFFRDYLFVLESHSFCLQMLQQAAAALIAAVPVGAGAAGAANTGTSQSRVQEFMGFFLSVQK